MMICIPRFLGFLFLWFTSVVGFADVGYIKHKIINNTPHELYVGIRQQFSYPIDSCLGIVLPNTTKECDGMFEMGYPNFMIEIIKNTPTREELKAFANFKNHIQNQSFLVDWSVDLDEAETLKVSFIAKNY